MSLPSTTLCLVYGAAQQSSGVCFLMALLLLGSGVGLEMVLSVFFKRLCAIYGLFFVLVKMIVGYWNMYRPLF